MTQLRAQQLTRANKLARAVWQVVYWLVFRLTPVPLHAWRAGVLRLFGASIGKRVRIYPSAKIWAPWNLVMADESCIGPDVDCYCVDCINLGVGAVVSQRSFLCTASHDYNSAAHTLMTAPILIMSHTWVTAEVYIGPGVVLNEGSVALARSVVIRSVDAWCVVGGNPAHFIKYRKPCHKLINSPPHE
ncbi:putative colanic acid biosynthesis acetyltransferase [Rhodoferax sp.]|uniref:putative colanic acid biosynthesis acetyltransferase n=1 Tax=Rhodoferax sp. TaxID=50421 RepID=UPI00260B9A41|nr:putative colanic acid biosynthesis acetyltransferase [Rhodoferax sp.]MDD2808227.1 putative colanic acid biosynthesis acetyltransferase [Rhodoferax sp.]MDD4941980.1 putative colanic acid biosynthesis acetyltransferase [Rhodoferax sp.]MDD5480348.1 putative colanic acid biosynthesis acetyltransferase [Rhodoferax sp.]